VNEKHEMEKNTIAVEKLHLVLVENGALDVVLRPELVVHQAVVTDIPPPAEYVAALVAGCNVMEVEDPIKAVVELDQHALAKTCGLD